MTTPLPPFPTFNLEPAPQVPASAAQEPCYDCGISLPCGETCPNYDAAPARAPADYVTIARAELERLLALVAGLQVWQADYERLKEKERVELLEPLPVFLTAPRLTEPTHCIPRLGEFPC